MPTPLASAPSALPELVEATRRLHAATLAAAVISSARRPHSLAEALQLEHQVFTAAYPPAEGPATPPQSSPDITGATSLVPEPAQTSDGAPETDRLSDGREEPRFGRREEPPPRDRPGQEVEIPPIPVLDQRRGGEPPLPPPLASAHEAVRRVRAAALSSVRTPAEQVSLRAASTGPAPRLVKAARRRPRSNAVVGLVAVLGATAIGMWTFERSAPASHPTPSGRAAVGAGRRPIERLALVGGPATAHARSAQSRVPIQLAIALSPILVGSRNSGGPAPAEAPPRVATGPAELYSAAVTLVDAGVERGVRQLTHLAKRDYPPAQFYLAKLYAAGSAGLTRNPAAARHWTKRAAEGGEARAMHNLALYLIDGTGGPKNPVSAAQWFQRAADLGLVDSQFNLGRLYEQGLGVSSNPAEALKWYAIAARAGDVDAGAAAARMRTKLSVQASLAAARSAAAFHVPGAEPVTGAAEIGSDSLAAAQRALSQLGYYQGPSDGAASPALRMALAAYQHDHGLPATGAADGATVARMSTLTIH